MEDRTERIKKAYKYLLYEGKVRSQADMASKMGVNRTSVSLAINGDARYTTDSFMKNLCASFPGVFNLDWLLTGNGTMEQTKKNEPTAVSPSEEIINLAARLIAENEALRRELRSALDDVRALRREMAASAATLQSSIDTFNAAASNLRAAEPGTLYMAAAHGTPSPVSAPHDFPPLPAKLSSDSPSSFLTDVKKSTKNKA